SWKIDHHAPLACCQFANLRVYASMHAPLLLLALAFVGENTPVQGPLKATRVETLVVIDGRLDEAVWQSAQKAENFRQKEPEEGKPATERTEVRILYDNSAIYIGAKLYDS